MSLLSLRGVQREGEGVKTEVSLLFLYAFVVRVGGPDLLFIALSDGRGAVMYYGNLAALY